MLRLTAGAAMTTLSFQRRMLTFCCTFSLPHCFARFLLSAHFVSYCFVYTKNVLCYSSYMAICMSKWVTHVACTSAHPRCVRRKQEWVHRGVYATTSALVSCRQRHEINHYLLFTLHPRAVIYLFVSSHSLLGYPQTLCTAINYRFLAWFLCCFSQKKKKFSA